MLVVTAVPTVLLEQLAAARRRGESFEAAWPDAFVAALRAAHRRERQDWADVLGGMVESWRAAWERRPATRPELALGLIAAEDRGVPLPARECEHCRGTIPDDRGRRGAPARYCSDRCCHAAHEARKQVAAVRRCPVCGASLAGRHTDTRTCSASCRREAARYRAVLSGRRDGPYSTLADLTNRRQKRE